MDNHENLIGKLLDGRYRIEAIVGEGGMSVVMKATDVKENKAVTVKMLNINDSAQDKNALERFTSEAKAVAMLSHKNIVSVYDVKLSGENKYIVMEFISGITLKEYLTKKKRLAWREAVHYINQVLEALSHAHSNGIIHRDIKPENVMLLRDGSIKLIDFGIAKLPDSKSITVIDKAIGTVNYISPEQASGQGSTDKSDIYSTGIMLYELTTGKLPFVSGSSVSVAMMHVSSEPAMPRSICDSIPVGLEQIIIKAMMKSPERRFGSATAMRKALEFLLLNPDTKFREKVVLGADGKPITGTGASQSSAGQGASANDIVDDDSDAQDRAASMLPIILGVTLAFFTVAVVCLFYAMNKFGIGELLSTDPRDNIENTLTVPALVGEVYTEWLGEELKNEGYILSIEYVYNVDAETDEIISQEPSADSQRKIIENGVPLKIYVNSGSSEIILDDYCITDQREASFNLDALGLKTKIVEEFHDTVINGYVIRTEPEAGNTVVPGDTITLFVSKGQEKSTVKMPKVIGMTVSQAERELIKKGISVKEKTYAPSEQYPDGTVIGCSIDEGTPVTPKYTSVSLVISKTEPQNEAYEAGAVSGYTPYR